MVRFVTMNKVVLSECAGEKRKCDHTHTLLSSKSIKAFVVLFVMLYKVVLALKSVDEKY